MRSHEPVELVALKLLRHDQARQEAAKAYSLGDALGNGTFGEVFAGTRKADNHPVAIKRLRKMWNNGFQEIVAEAVILDRIRGHPHVKSVKPQDTSLRRWCLQRARVIQEQFTCSTSSFVSAA